MNLYQRAKQLRKNSTKAERILWAKLSNKQINGLKFRRQAVVADTYIADFYCPSLKLIIEIDGVIHNNVAVKNNDLDRTKQLELSGFNIIRFKNIDVLSNVEEVIVNILRVSGEISPP